MICILNGRVPLHNYALSSLCWSCLLEVYNVYILYNYTTLYQHYTNIILHSYYIWQCMYTCSMMMYNVYILYNYTTLYQHYTHIILHSYYICSACALVQWCIMCIFCITIQLYTNILLTLYCIHTIFDSMCT